MMLLKVSSATGMTMNNYSAGRVHPPFIADPAVRHTFVLVKILIRAFWESAETQHSVVVS
jgi:hypothetical protein